MVKPVVQAEMPGGADRERFVRKNVDGIDVNVADNLMPGGEKLHISLDVKGIWKFKRLKLVDIKTEKIA